MISLPIFIFLAIYFLFLLLALFFFFFGIYHIAAAGEFSLISFIMTVFISGSLLIVIAFTWITLTKQNINWSAPFSLFENTWLSTPDLFE